MVKDVGRAVRVTEPKMMSTVSTKLRAAVFIAVIAALAIIKPFDYLPTACAWSAAGVVPLVIIAFVVRSARRSRDLMRRMSTPDLERSVWRYEPDYFNWLGPDEPCVIEFRQVTESRDIGRLQARWPALEAEFWRLERRVGHRGRPMIMDFYAEQSQAIAELARRSSGMLPPNTA